MLSLRSIPGIILLTAVSLLAPITVSPGPPPVESQSPQLKGQLLVASSRVLDPRFQETVILIAEHSATGAMGLIVNKPARKVTIGELLEQAAMPRLQKNEEIWIYHGGPVAPGHMFLLHSTSLQVESSHTIIDGIALSADPEILQLIAEGKGPEEYLLLLGYSGWGPQQLEGELSAGSWITVDADLSLVFAKEPEKTWERIMQGHRL